MITLFQTLRAILARLMRNPLRGTLSMLSIALGVTVVALVLNLSFRLGEQVRTVEQEGALRIVVANAERIENGIQWQGPPVFTAGDAEALRRDYPDLKKISPLSRPGAERIQVGEDIYRPRAAMGVGVDYPAIVGLTMKAGSFFTGRDVAAKANIVVISEEAARLLFGGVNQAVGRTILNLESGTRMIVTPDGGPAAPQNTKTPFKVVGVYASLPPLVQQAFGVADFLVPYTVGGWPGGTIDTLYCLVAGEDFAASRANLERYFRGRYGDEVKLAVWQDDPRFPFDNNAANLRRTQRTVTLFFGAFGLVALLVSSFGIFSVMTVNTLERTREIGLCRTIGATKTRVVGDFLFEALALSVMGALLGLALATVFNGPVIKAIQPLLGGPAAMDAALAPMGLGLPAALCAVAVSALAGVLFGLFPAFSAARVEPVESLREG